MTSNMNALDQKALVDKVQETIVAHLAAHGPDIRPSEAMAIVAAALSLAVAEAVEPVAWRVKDYADGWIYYTDEERARIEGEVMSGALVQPLFASPPTASRPKVKPLEWSFYDGFWWAYAHPGTAMSGYRVSGTHWCRIREEGKQFFADTNAEAKAAAQADYEARVTAALSPDIQGPRE